MKTRFILAALAAVVCSSVTSFAQKNVDPEGKTKARVVDIYRLEDGMLAEHWDVLMPCV